MKLIIELGDREINPDFQEPEERVFYSVRKACRGVLFNDEGKIALMHVGKYNIYKLPGGGVDAGETYAEALARELDEETGCVGEVVNEIGITIEYRNEWKMLQMSFCYTLRLVEDKHTLNLTEEEKESGFELIWVGIDEAINLVENESAPGYDEKFMKIRDLALLKEAKAVLAK